MTKLTIELRQMHAPTDHRVKHWCSRYGGSLEEAHAADAPKACRECGDEMEWPCDTIKAVERATSQYSASITQVIRENWPTDSNYVANWHPDDRERAEAILRQCQQRMIDAILEVV
jgi:hypothetical protein